MKKILLGISLSVLAWTSMQAHSQPSDGVEVYFTDKKPAFELVLHSHKQLISLNEKLTTMRELAIQAINSSKSNPERLVFDEQYQNLMTDLNKIIRQTITPSLYKNSENNIILFFYNAGRLSGLKLPDLDATTLGINSESINIASKQNAKLAMKQLGMVTSWLETQLPESTKLPAIEKSLASAVNSNEQYNLLTMSHKGDRQKVLAALIKFRNVYTAHLFHMMDLAEQASAKDVSQSRLNELNLEFRQYQYAFDALEYGVTLLGDIRLFNNNELEYELNGTTKLYSFDKISMSKFNLQGTSLTNMAEAQLSLEAVDAATDFVNQLIMRN